MANEENKESDLNDVILQENVVLDAQVYGLDIFSRNYSVRL